MRQRIARTVLFCIFICSFCLKIEAARPFSSIKYDMTLSGGDVPGELRQTMYIKAENIRSEINTSGKKIIMLIREGKEAYSYIPDENMAMRIPIPAEKPAAELDYLKMPEMKIIGQDIVDGRPCDLYQGLIKGKTVKMWVAKDIQFPLRMEVETPKGKIVSRFSNIQINPVLSDNLFVVPQGVKIIDMSSMGQMPQGLSGGYYGQE